MKKQRGFSLIELMVVVAIVGIIATLAFQALIDAQKEKKRLELGTMLENKRSVIGHEITKSKSRAKTLETATNFSKDCDPPSGVPTSPLTAAACGTTQYGGTANFQNEFGALVVETLTANVGFNNAGERCTTFDAINGDDSCPFRAELRWLGSCVPTGTTGGCKNPEMFYDVTFKYMPKNNRVVLNPAKYNFNQNSFGVLNTRWIPKITNFNAESGEHYIVNTATNAADIIATLPAAPSTGDTIAFVDGAGSFATNKLIINGNGQKIMGEPVGDTMDVDMDYMSFELMYYDTANGWRIK